HYNITLTSYSSICSTTLTILSFFLYHCTGHHRDLHSFPTRRSSDLMPRAGCWKRAAAARQRYGFARTARGNASKSWQSWPDFERSEEHTSELQSREKLVCRLLLEKKKKNKL